MTFGWFTGGEPPSVVSESVKTETPAGTQPERAGFRNPNYSKGFEIMITRIRKPMTEVVFSLTLLMPSPQIKNRLI